MTTDVEYENRHVYLSLLKAQGEFEPIVKDSENPHFRSRFASLAGIKKIVDPVLRSNDLLLIQPVIGDVLQTLLIHVPTGGVIESNYPIPPQDAPQKTGSALSYARRYALCAILGIVADDDDDGAAASGTSGPPLTNTPASGGGLKDRVAGARAQTAPAIKNPDESLTSRQLGMINGKTGSLGWSDSRVVQEIFTITGKNETPETLTKGEASMLIDALIKRESMTSDEPLPIEPQGDWDEEF